MKNKIFLSPPSIGNIEKNYLKKCINSNWIAPIGPSLNLFENKLQKYIKCKYAVGLTSGTSAIHLALINLNVKKDDYVICQSFTFAGTAFPILYQNAKPIFIDSEINSWNLDPELVENAILDKIKINKKPKAIIAVHLYGSPFNFKKIVKISKKYNIPIIEDAAEALGSEYYKKKCGNLGDISILSFNGNKIITTGGGGALLTNSALISKNTKYLASQAKDNTIYYSHKNIGFNYRLSNVLASIGNGQMDNLDKILSKRKKNFKRYKNFFKNYPEITVVDFNLNKNIKTNHWLTTILIDRKKNKKINKNLIISFLKNHNIECRPLWKPLHTQLIFKKYKYYGNNISDNLYKNGLCVPSGSNLSDNDFKNIFKVFTSLLK